MSINWKPVKDFAEIICGVVVYGLVVAATDKMAEVYSGGRNNVTAGYDDAVSAIMKSGMYSHDKSDAVAALKRYGGAEFYGAIIHIAKDDSMFSHDKVNMIRALSEK